MLATDLRVSSSLLAAGAGARHSGTRLMNLLSILAFVVASWMLSTTAGGMWMFYRRMTQTPEYLDSRVASLDYADGILQMYVSLGYVACVLIIPPIISLASNAAVLGATGREEKMAVLRLLGASSRRTTTIALAMTLVQALIGLLLGLALSMLTAPLWSNVSFQFTAIRGTEMILPWWGYLAVVAVFLIVVLASAIWGLRRVYISPLGVARKTPAKTLTWGRLVFFLVVAAAALIIGQGTNIMSAGGIIILAVVGGMFLIGYAVVMPLIIQVLARVLAALAPGAATNAAARRNQMSPLRAWNRVSALGLLAFGLGMIGGMPLQEFQADQQMEDVALVTDMFTGTFIVVAFGFLTAATSTLLTQASAVFENRERDEAFRRMGVPRTFPGRVAAWEVLGPLVLVTVIAFTLGFQLAMVMYQLDSTLMLHLRSAVPQMLTLLAGYALMIAALGAAEVLRRAVADEPSRS